VVEKSVKLEGRLAWANFIFKMRVNIMTDSI
jgi:hypothetical protein